MVWPSRCATAFAAHRPARALHHSTSEVKHGLPFCPPSATKVGLQRQIQALCRQGQLDRALETLCCPHIPSSPAIYAPILKACGRAKALPQAEYVLQHIARHDIELPILISDYLVVTLAKCGNVDVACHMFLLLPHRTAFSWTAIASAFTECGHSQEALDVYHFMRNDGIEADSFTYATLFKACGSVPNLEYGRVLHREACKKGFASDVFVSNTLVSMYGKCSAVSEAENVFSQLAQRDVISWNALLSTYVEQGQGKKALLCYRQMQDQDVDPDKQTVIFALQACEICVFYEDAFDQQGQDTHQMCLDIGKTLHAYAHVKGFASDIFVGTALLQMYGRCGAIIEAKGIFRTLSEHDIVAWNALLSAYNEWGQGAECLQLYVHIQNQGVTPDRLTHMLSFQACSILAEKEEHLLVEGRIIRSKALEIGKALHAVADIQGHASVGFVSNALLNMYIKCGDIIAAENVFCSICERDTVSFSVMVSAYLEQEQIEKAFWLYRQMQHEGVSADHCVFMSVARACGTLAESVQTVDFEQSSLKMAGLEIGEALHADVQKGAFARNTFLNTTLLRMYSKCGAMEKAEYVIVLMSQRDTVSWNALLSAYVENRQGEKALQAYIQMLRDSLRPDELTFVCAIQACGILAEKDEVFNGQETPRKTICLEIGQALRMDARNLGLSESTIIGTALLTMYGKCGAVNKAENAFRALSDSDIVTWNAMLSVLIEHSQEEKALCLYRDMQRQGMMVNDVTYICVMSACSDAGSLEVCQQLHFCIVGAGHELISSVSSALVHAYGNCGVSVDSQTVFEGLCKPDSISWTACLAGHASMGDSSTCIGVFENLKLEGIEPDEVMLTSVMSACSRAGHVSEGVEFFTFLKGYGLGLGLKHYGIMVELLGRAGDFIRLENFLEIMEVKADLTLWTCLLGSCHAHQNLELAKRTFDCAANLQSKLAMPYVLMANIIAEVDCTTEGG